MFCYDCQIKEAISQSAVSCVLSTALVGRQHSVHHTVPSPVQCYANTNIRENAISVSLSLKRQRMRQQFAFICILYCGNFIFQKTFLAAFLAQTVQAFFFLPVKNALCKGEHSLSLGKAAHKNANFCISLIRHTNTVFHLQTPVIGLHDA